MAFRSSDSVPPVSIGKQNPRDMMLPSFIPSRPLRRDGVFIFAKFFKSVIIHKKLIRTTTLPYSSSLLQKLYITTQERGCRGEQGEQYEESICFQKMEANHGDSRR